MSVARRKFTKHDIIKLIADKRLDMSNLSARRLSTTQVIIEVENQEGVDVLSAPSNYKNSSLVDLLLHSFTLPDYALKSAISEKRRRSSSTMNYFSFIDSYFEASIQENTNTIANHAEVPPESISAWHKHLLATHSESYSWICLNALQKIISRTLTYLHGKISNWPKQVRAIWLALKATTPAKPAHEKKPPLGVYLEISPTVFHNDELFMGFRYGVIWLLQKLNSQRKNIVENSLISGILQRNQRKTLKEFDSSFAWTIKKNKNASPDRLNLLSEVLRCIQSDVLVTEWQCYSFKQLQPLLGHDGQLLPYKDQAELLSRYTSEEGSFRTQAKGYGRNDTAWKPLKKWLGTAGSGNSMPRFAWWGSDLVTHLALERLLMVWLLASERAQRSGIEKLTLDALHFSDDRPKSLQISTLKLRRAINPSSSRHLIDVNTQIYKRNDPPFSVYLNWHKTVKHAHDYFSGHNPHRRFIYPLSNQISGVISMPIMENISMAYLPLELLATPGTTWSKTFLKESGNSREAQAFITILASCIKKKRINPRSLVSIPPSCLGQSLVMKKELANNSDSSAIEIESEAMGHSTTTGRNVYKDGFSKLDVKEIIEPVRAFARRVGDEKILLAEKLADQMNSQVRKIEFSELEHLCGIGSATSKQKDLLALLDEQDKITISGEVEVNGELLVVESDFTAALMYGYIEHLEASIPEIMLTNRDEAALQYLSKYLYLHQIFQGLDPHIQQAGKRLAEQTDFPFPPLN